MIRFMRNNADSYIHNASIESNAEITGQDAALLSVCEVGLGSILHGFQIPLAGYFLSLNQIFLLSRSVFKTRSRTVASSISGIAAMLKSLSPVGKKLTPMLAIACQGSLFSLGTILLGPNLAGTILGAILASVWGFLQPLLIYYLIFGNTLLHAFEYFLKQIQTSISFFEVTPHRLKLAVVALIIIKAMLAISLVVIARFLSESRFQKWQVRLQQTAKKSAKLKHPIAQNPTLAQNALAASRDLRNPFFIGSLVMTMLFFLFSEASVAQYCWYLLRILSSGFICFLLVRQLPLELVQKRSPSFGIALERLKELLR